MKKVFKKLKPLLGKRIGSETLNGILCFSITSFSILALNIDYFILKIILGITLFYTLIVHYAHNFMAINETSSKILTNLKEIKNNQIFIQECDEYFHKYEALIYSQEYIIGVKRNEEKTSVKIFDNIKKSEVCLYSADSPILPLDWVEIFNQEVLKLVDKKIRELKAVKTNPDSFEKAVQIISNTEKENQNDLIMNKFDSQSKEEIKSKS